MDADGDPGRQRTLPVDGGQRSEHFLLARDRGRLVGMVGLWDQHAFKQTRVLAYRRPLGWLRPFYNAHSALRGGPRLPRAGGCLRYQTVHTVVVADNDPGLLRPLLAEAQARSGRADGLILRLFQHDPLRAALQGGGPARAPQSPFPGRLRRRSSSPAGFRAHPLFGVGPPLRGGLLLLLAIHTDQYVHILIGMVETAS